MVQGDSIYRGSPLIFNRYVIVERKSGKTLGYFSGKGRLAGQMEFPDSIAIDKGGNIYVGEVDSGKRIQRFAPVLAGAR